MLHFLIAAGGGDQHEHCFCLEVFLLSFAALTPSAQLLECLPIAPSAHAELPPLNSGGTPCLKAASTFRASKMPYFGLLLLAIQAALHK